MWSLIRQMIRWNERSIVWLTRMISMGALVAFIGASYGLIFYLGL